MGMVEVPPNMKILVADDDEISRLTVAAALRDWGYLVTVCHNGADAWQTLIGDSAPRLALIDWLMPEIDGLELCRRIRAASELRDRYLILLTARDTQADIIAGLEAGADDYVAKPFDRDELRLRIKTGERILKLQAELAERVHQLEVALGQVRTLQGILPICAYCKKIRKDANYWQQVEAYLASHVDVSFSHGICPDCYETRVKAELEKLHGNAPPYPT